MPASTPASTGVRQTEATHCSERHVAPVVQGSPSAEPQRPSLEQTPLRQVASDVHAEPFGSPHLPSPLHTPLRHAAPTVHALSFLRPHRPSPSQSSATQTRAPAATEHVPEMGAEAGSGCPFGIFGVHVPPEVTAVGLSHHLPGQSPSAVQGVPHAPDTRLQIGPRRGPLAQSSFDVHLSHAPLPLQYGDVVDEQVMPVANPKSPSQPTQLFWAGSHSGAVEVGTHAPIDVAVQATQRLVLALQTGLPVEQSSSTRHSSHRPAWVPRTTQRPWRHCRSEAHVPLSRT